MRIWDAFTPVLSVVTLRGADASAHSMGVKADNRLLFGNGCNLDEIERSNDSHGYSLKWRCKVFDEKGCNIDGCIVRNDKLIIVYGDKSLAFLTRSDDDDCARMEYTFHFDDWIRTAKIVDEGSLVILFASNTVVAYALNESESNDRWMIELNECKRIRSSHKAVLLNSLLDGNSWPRLRAVVGTVMGDILIWYPSEGPDITQHFIGHTGMIFGMVLEEDGTKEYLYSISDDRSLRLWSVKRCIQLDQVYGHLARPFAICNVLNQPDMNVITAGQRICKVVSSRRELSESGCVWLAKGDEEANAVCEYGSNLLIGTRKGTIVIIDERKNEIIHSERYCHGRQSISDMLVRYPTLYSIGRDGKLLVWKVVEQQDDVNRGTIKLNLLQRRTPSFWLDMEWPCNFIKKRSEEKTFWIGGFHGKKFVLIDYETGYELCEVNCGGGHRKWQFSKSLNNNSGNDAARFTFLSKGVLLQIDVTLARFDLISLYQLRLKGDARLIDVHLNECQPNFSFVISASDSRLEWYRLKEDRSGIESFISLSSILRTNHQTSNLVITKLKCILSKRSIHTLYAITTSGLLMIFEDIHGNPHHYRIYQVQKAGLSALDVMTFEGQQSQCIDDKSILISIGSESGRVHVMSMQLSPNNQHILKYIDWHGTTCTDIRLHESAIDKSTKVISISLDCRLAVFSFSQLKNKLELHRALMLNVSDPSSFCFITNQQDNLDKIVVVGSCLQIVPFDELLL
ncbi:unnamed protein product [Anisakis simplex]|uniref:tRNA (34-2'-O)-methyltransferase regulator WDR6 n=1 Tax=Anisakis simplex TaxID=6269 RepID=A0A0M3JVU4_ANISI|nr:unnamed protein product [Anisakis simplex]